MHVASDAEEHILAQLGHVDRLVALEDNIGVALLAHFGIENGIVTHPLV